MPKKRKEPEPPAEVPGDEDEDEEEEEEEQEEQEEQQNEEEEEEGEPPEGETSEARLRRLKAARRNSRRNARQTGYRKWAKAAGLKSGGSFGNDMLQSVFSASDIVRMATWCPHTATDAGIDLPEFKALLGMRDESLPPGPVKVLQANVESFARKLVGDVVMRSIESGGMTITAANVRSVLRPFNSVLRTEFSTPLGLVRAAQHVEKGEETILPRSNEEEIAITEERKFAKANHVKLMREADKKREADAAERKKKHKERAASGGGKKKKVVANGEMSVTATA
jgi:hypothetical protein